MLLNLISYKWTLKQRIPLQADDALGSDDNLKIEGESRPCAVR